MVKRKLGTLLLLLWIGWTTGCNQIGPGSINNGRNSYNQAIIQTNDQQTLKMIVRLRYAESVGMLAVNSVTANIRFRSGIGADFSAWGTRSSVSGNLVPLGTNLAYEENPTISYTPIDGAAYIRELLSPISVNFTFLLLESMGDLKSSMLLLFESVNGVQNPAFLVDGHKPNQRFVRWVELVLELDQAGAIHWRHFARGNRNLAMVISRYAPNHTHTVKELLELVEVSAEGITEGKDIILASQLSDGTTDGPEHLSIKTRSVLDLLTIASASIDIPTEHIESGLARSYPQLGAVAHLIQIHRSAESPDTAMVAVKHHDWWYYIDATDTSSKDYFRLMQVLISEGISESAKKDAQTPVLTVPVGR